LTCNFVNAFFTHIPWIHSYTIMFILLYLPIYISDIFIFSSYIFVVIYECKTDGPDADRWSCLIQQAFYNGWKSIHGLKHQTVDNAYGMTMDIHGPTSVRANDLRVLGESNFIGRMVDLYDNEQVKVKIYGDSIYPHVENLTSSYRNHPNTPRQIQENHAYKSVRISIEWNYMVTGNTFTYLKNLDKLKVLHTTNCAQIYRACTLLRNCHVCLYGSISSTYFDLVLPHNMLERYMKLEV